MKRFFVILGVLLFVLFSIFSVKYEQTKTVSSSSKTSGFAKIITNDCYLLKTPKQNEENKYFLLEQSYFVKVVEDFDNVFFKVNYLEFEGYVEKSKINFVEELPEMPYLSGITFDIYDLANVCMRSSASTPNDDKNIICTIPVSTKDILYYGKFAGEEAIKGLGNVWYYCAYQNVNGDIFKGYIYSPLTRNISSIASSTENLTFVNISKYVPIDSLLYLNITTKNMLIVITAIPTLAIMIILSKSKKKTNA